MNFKKETHDWGGHKYIRVSKKKYNNFVKYFNKLEGNYFMDWYDLYDWSLNPGFDASTATENELWDNIHKCMVAREYCEYYGRDCHYEYYIREDYIKSKNYDLNTVVYKTKRHK